jgi:hypothetical protein
VAGAYRLVECNTHFLDLSLTTGGFFRMKVHSLWRMSTCVTAPHALQCSSMVSFLVSTISVSGLLHCPHCTKRLMNPSSSWLSRFVSCAPLTIARPLASSNLVCAPSSVPKYLVVSVQRVRGAYRSQHGGFGALGCGSGDSQCAVQCPGRDHTTEAPGADAQLAGRPSALATSTMFITFVLMPLPRPSICGVRRTDGRRSHHLLPRREHLRASRALLCRAGILYLDSKVATLSERVSQEGVRRA